MAILKKQEDIDGLREAGRHLAAALDAVAAAVAPGVTTEELDTLAERFIREGGDKPSFLGYTPAGSGRPYPATLCVSINDEVVHGIPNERVKTLASGDIVGIDIGLIHAGCFVDMARTVPVGVVDEAGLRLMDATEQALMAGIAAAVGGNRIGDISYAIEQSARESGFSVVRELGGHGVGRAVHETPHVPNIGSPGTGSTLIEGLVIAIEPMLNEGTRHIVLDRDGYTYKTKDGKRSAHFEHTIRITPNEPEIVTRAA